MRYTISLEAAQKEVRVLNDAKAVTWMALSESEKNDCLRLTDNSLSHAVNFAWEHYL